MKFLRRNFIFLVVFITGGAVLIIEITAFRILSPYFGNTLFATSSIIGIILLALSLGYYLGGILVDRMPKYSLFFFLIFLGGFFSLLISILSKTVLPGLGNALNIREGPLISSLLLFFVPGAILGVMSPFAIKLKSLESRGIGKISGKIFFWGTLGSIAGNFLTGFILLPHLGINTVLISTSTLLIVLGLLGLIVFRRDGLLHSTPFRVFLIVLLFLTVFFLALSLLLPSVSGKEVIFEKDGFYSKISIIERYYNDKPTRLLILDRSLESAIFLDSDELPFKYTKYYALYQIVDKEIETALFLGAGAYTMPRKLLLEEEDIKRVDVAEIDPELYELAKKYFRLEDNPKLFNHITDGRYFLRKTNEAYDMIFIDVYEALISVPSHFTTQEFFSLAKEKLSDKGLVAINIIGALEKEKNIFLISEMKTFRSVFKNSYFFAVDNPNYKGVQNFIFLGLNSNEKIDFSSPEIKESKNETIRNLPEKLIDIDSLNIDSAYLFTDDFAPTDYLIGKVI